LEYFRTLLFRRASSERKEIIGFGNEIEYIGAKIKNVCSVGIQHNFHYTPDNTKCDKSLYSGTPLYRTVLGPNKLSGLKRVPV